MINEKLVTTFTDGDCEVSLYQHADGRFSVLYGKQLKVGLDYADAAKEFGECVFHSLACASKLDNEEGADE